MRNFFSLRMPWNLLVSYIFLTVLAIVSVFPLLWITLTSFKSASETSQYPIALFPKEITFENYIKIFQELGIGTNMLNSLLVSVTSTSITIVVSSLAAYGIVRFFPNAGKKMTRVLLMTYMFPSILLAVPYTIIMTQVGLINSWTGLIIAYLSFAIPFSIWMLVGFFRTVPLEIEESASVDGAGKLRVFIQIVIPIIAPGIVATAIYTFIITWNEFLFALLFMSSSDKMPVAVALYSLTGSEVLDWGAVTAASVVVILPAVIFFMLIQKHISGGLSEGSIK